MSRTYRFDRDGQLLRRYNRPRFPDGTPKEWRKYYMTRPRRHLNKKLCREVLKGRDPDLIVWPLGNNKPQVWYW